MKLLMVNQYSYLM